MTRAPETKVQASAVREEQISPPQRTMASIPTPALKRLKNYPVP
jgi:hypothetical protein